MARYVVMRCIFAAINVYLVATLAFFMIRAAPGDVLLANLGDTGRLTPAALEQARKELGLDEPVMAQYWDWLSDAARGDLGNSLVHTGHSTTGKITNAFPKTLELVAFSTVIALLLALPLGVLAALRRDSLIDVAAQVFAVLGLAVPTFFLGTVLVIYGSIWFGVSPASDQPSIFRDPLANLQAFLAPSLVLGFSTAATTMRMMRSSVLEILGQDYIRTARAKGVRERVVVSRHVVKNALVPVVTIFGNQFAFALGGSVIVEFLFNIDGLGSLTFTAITQRDYPQVTANALVFGAIVVTVNLIVDLTYPLLDPRIRLT